jgi:hypothetical protein
VTAVRWWPVAALIGGALATSGCFVSPTTHPYHLAHPFVDQGRAASIALAVTDRRQFVAAGGRPDFVGKLHPGRDVTTASGQPLAADVAVSIRRGLEAAGYRVALVRVMERSRPETVASALVKAGGELLMAVQIDVWRYDSHVRAKLDYDVTMRVLDARGQELGRAQVSGLDVLTGDPAAKVPTVYLEKLEQLLNDPAIKRGMAAAASLPIAPAMPVAPAPDQPPPPPSSEPSVVVPRGGPSP